MLIISIIVMCGMIIYENYTNKKNKPIKIYPDIDLDIRTEVLTQEEFSTEVSV